MQLYRTASEGLRIKYREADGSSIEDTVNSFAFSRMLIDIRFVFYKLCLSENAILMYSILIHLFLRTLLPTAVFFRIWSQDKSQDKRFKIFAVVANRSICKESSDLIERERIKEKIKWRKKKGSAINKYRIDLDFIE